MTKRQNPSLFGAFSLVTFKVYLRNGVLIRNDVAKIIVGFIMAL